MEKQDNRQPDIYRPEGPTNRGRAYGGLIIIIIGLVMLARQLGVEFPYWIFSWSMLLIAVGVYVGVRHSFRNPGWMIPVGIGLLFLTERLVPELELKQYIWPIAVIAGGLFIMFKPRGRQHGAEYWKHRFDNSSSESLADSGFESVTIFGGDKKHIVSKDFRGGESVCVFGGVEINLTQADILGRAEIEVVQIFGGTKIIVPPHWKVQTDELVCVFGTLEDKRQIMGSSIDATKTLVLKGTCMFGGIDLRSF